MAPGTSRDQDRGWVSLAKALTSPSRTSSPRRPPPRASPSSAPARCTPGKRPAASPQRHGVAGDPEAPTPSRKHLLRGDFITLGQPHHPSPNWPNWEQLALPNPGEAERVRPVVSAPTSRRETGPPRPPKATRGGWYLHDNEVPEDVDVPEVAEAEEHREEPAQHHPP